MNGPGERAGAAGPDAAAATPRALRLFLAAQGAYYVIAGVWPLVSMPAFESVTGSKTDDWLVHMVGVLAAVIGVTLLVGLRRPRGAVTTLAVLAALGFAAIDIVYTWNGTIRPIYLGDAVVELALAAAVLVSSRRGC